VPTDDGALDWIQSALDAGNTPALIRFVDPAGVEWRAAAIISPATNSDGELIALHETEGTGLKQLEIKVVTP
jgi:hypothetical protein